jgi:penicillin-binding protein 1C
MARLSGKCAGMLALLGGTVGGLFALAFVLAQQLPLPERLGEQPSVVVEYRDGDAAHVFITADGRWRAPVSLDRVDPAYVRALLRLEDKRFHSHWGVDPWALGRAAWQNLSRVRRVSGASTLTLQLVRVLEPRPRTLRSKVIEAARAYQLELRLPKRALLEAYLQFVPYGRNLEGVETAALAYFGHDARHLSAAEVATLLAVPQSPARRMPSLANEASLRMARDGIAQRLLAVEALPLGKGGEASAVLAEVRSTPVPTRVLPFPREAAHWAVALRAQAKGGRVRTTLDRGTQTLVEAQLARYRELASSEHIHNAGVLLVDHRTSEVVAAAGNFDFWDTEHSGQWSSLDVPRSPGSALKPFLYALAVDRGWVTADTLVPDLPVQFGGWAPKNFDGQFHGLVRMEDALSLSLNLPFVHLLRKLTVEGFLTTLRQGGVTSLRTEPGHYGLSSAIGGLELTPLEVAGLYAALAEDGQFRPLQRVLASPGADPAPRTPLFSAGAAWLTRRALALKDRPDFPSRRAQSALPHQIHWKTGTSFGLRDAWAAGSTPTHTAVVWMGNLDNQGSSALVGAQAAAPLLFDLLETQDTREGAAWRLPSPPPTDLISVDVCAYSGHPATEACPHTRLTQVLRSAVPTEPCPFHVRVEVDVKTSRAVTPLCRGSATTEWRTFALWPSALKRYRPLTSLPLPEPPALAEGCAPAPGLARDLSITSPAEGETALLLPGVPTARQEIAFEAEARGAGKLSWFIDGRFLGTVAPEQTLWWEPAVGRHEVVVTDESGTAARRRFDIALRRN